MEETTKLPPASSYSHVPFLCFSTLSFHHSNLKVSATGMLPISQPSETSLWAFSSHPHPQGWAGVQTRPLSKGPHRQAASWQAPFSGKNDLPPRTMRQLDKQRLMVFHQGVSQSLASSLPIPPFAIGQFPFTALFLSIIRSVSQNPLSFFSASSWTQAYQRLSRRFLTC